MYCRNHLVFSHVKQGDGSGREKKRKEQLEMEISFNRMNEELNNQLTYASVPNISIEDTLSNVCLLSELVSQNPVLVFRYSGLNCGTCYGVEIIALQNIFSREDQQIAILSSYKEKRHFTAYRKDFGIDFPFYLIPQDAFDWILEDYGSPYYFVLHPDLTVSHIFIPDIVLTDLNKQYVKKIKKLLSN
jgi:hypothetical protein